MKENTSRGNFGLFVILGEGAVKLQPMPLPQGMTPSSTEIIASLNEHLIQVLQVRNIVIRHYDNTNSSNKYAVNVLILLFFVIKY